MGDMPGGGGGGGGGPEWEEVPRYVTRTKRMRMDRGAFMAEYGTGRNRTAAGAAKLAALGLGRYRVRRRLRRGGLRRLYRRYRGRGLYSGSGGFWSDLWNKSAGLRGHLGGLARASSNPYLQLAGRASQMLGTGAYEGGEPQTVNNEIVDGGAGLGVPTFSSGGGEMGTITISHREYVADVFGPDAAGTFQNVTYGINPGLPNTFPWLSQVAANYEEYTIKQLIFTFRSTVTDFVASNGQVGTILLATQYNANDAPFSSKQDMMEYAGAVSAKVSMQVVAGVECDPAQLSGPPGKYTRSGPTPPGEDVKTYDLGTLNVATSNTPLQFNNQAVGELWVSYTIELRKPKFFVTRAQQLLTDVFIGDQAGVPAGLNAFKWGMGQQNRIGGLLCTEYGPSYPVQGGVLYYVFPATFSGNVEINLWAQAIAGAPSGQGSIFVEAQNPPPGTTQPPGIVPINDLWGATQTPRSVVASNTATTGWLNYQLAESSASTVTVPIIGTINNVGAMMYKGHFKVVSPTTAASTVDNVLAIGCTQQVIGFSLQITMYNTGLNYSRVDRPIIANPATTQVIEFPANAGSVP